MNCNTIRRLVLIFAALFYAGGASAATYYVNYSSGADTNAGISKTAPWQHAPGMAGCANTCNTTTIHPGDSIILKGGVTWPNGSLPWSPPSGSSGNPVYVGVDKTWYTGGSWTRPIINAQAAQAGTDNIMFPMTGSSYVTVDNLEITGFYWSSAICNGLPWGSCSIFNLGQATNQTFENLYIHGWTHAGTSSSSNNGVIDIFLGDTHIPNQDTGSSIHDCVIDGSDVSADHSANGIFGGPSTIYENVFNQLSSAMVVNGSISVHDNLIENINQAYCNIPTSGLCTHENAFEDNGDVGLNFYNNVIAHTASGVVNLWLAPNTGYTAAAWNNVEYDVGNNNVVDVANSVPNNSCPQTGSYCTSGGTLLFYNNTIECGLGSEPTANCLGGNASYSAVTFENNYLITNGTFISGCSGGCSASNNTEQTPSQANQQNDSSSETFAFSLTALGNATAGTGSNLTSTCTGNLVSLCSDTTYAVSYNTTSHTVVVPARTPLSRPSSGVWDTGAYEFGTVAGQPAPPSGLIATVE